MGSNRSIDLEREGKRGTAILHSHQRLGSRAHGVQEGLDLQTQRLTGLDRDLA